MMQKVVQFPGSGLRLKELVGPSGKGLIALWLSSYPGARAKFRVRVKYLRLTPQVQWNRKQFRNLGSGLSEIKWKYSDKEFRVVGFYRSGHFVMLLGCTHKQGVYDPHNWLQTAKQRKREVENEEWSTIEHEP
jgi:phage-related protein